MKVVKSIENGSNDSNGPRFLLLAHFGMEAFFRISEMLIGWENWLRIPLVDGGAGILSGRKSGSAGASTSQP